MLENVLFLCHSGLLLVFGILSSTAFSGIGFSWKNTGIVGSLCLFCGALQAVLYVLGSEEVVRRLYPLITHLPLLLVLCLCYRRTLTSAFAAICTAYLYCQPAKWLGLLVFHVTQSTIAQYCVCILALLALGFGNILMGSYCMSGIFNKDHKSILIFSIIPMVYYFFDYITGVYVQELFYASPVVSEFLPFFLAIIFMAFCAVYYKEYEQKADAERKEQLLRITAQQQAKEVETVRRSSQEVRLLRHDMRLFLSSLAVCIQDGNTDKAMEMINGYATHIDGTRPEYFCGNDTVNYVLSDFAAKCEANGVPFSCNVKLDTLSVEEIRFCSVLSNALDNALNAQLSLPQDRRLVKLMLKESDGKLLMSVKNPVARPPVFSADGLPVTHQENHGYGTQSIRFMTERLGGSCQFSYQEGLFVLRVIL